MTVDGLEHERRHPDLRVLAERLDSIKELLNDLKGRMDRIEERATKTCRDCAAWDKLETATKRITVLELQAERAKGMVIGVSSLIGLAWTVVSYLISH